MDDNFKRPFPIKNKNKKLNRKKYLSLIFYYLNSKKLKLFSTKKVKMYTTKKTQREESPFIKIVLLVNGVDIKNPISLDFSDDDPTDYKSVMRRVKDVIKRDNQIFTVDFPIFTEESKSQNNITPVTQVKRGGTFKLNKTYWVKVKNCNEGSEEEVVNENMNKFTRTERLQISEENISDDIEIQISKTSSVKSSLLLSSSGKDLLEILKTYSEDDNSDKE
jgi:hypothetical protein